MAFKSPFNSLVPEPEDMNADIGLPGEQGPAGPPGEQGPQGDKGEKGEKGEKGDPGIQGERGPEGPQGIQGPAGKAGRHGQDGKDGHDGRPGERGEAGPRGPKGDRGEPGKRGQEGRKGDKGDTGPEGPQGPPGEIPKMPRVDAPAIPLKAILPKGGTTDQIIIKQSSQNYDVAWGAQPSGFTPNVFHAYDNTGGMNASNTLQVVVFDTEVVSDSYYSYNTVTGKLTFQQDGFYRVDVNVGVDVDSTSGGPRGNPRIWLYENTGGGDVVVQGAHATGYIREDSSRLGETLSVTVFREWDNGDVIFVYYKDPILSHADHATRADCSTMSVEFIRSAL